ncbi:hypothetical protein CGCF415_v010831 [Colletotrichum fructicola]|uniref:Uncharacterized protein n=1 Tax=Colletotrichum fructicola (strain Nara gc5) TaxID=1213859 RepID=A0A7J6JL44_COLFN|nr:hypothetical protein CFRS1_v004291 [Colletotrichum fructicola]KAF4491434.1 hypothetical protein CGGC5_v001545 [Colletotrichum fructicola Nara gc5]KAF4898223.1 hypothetical protein CGCF415_v010831 [Colletotrichum fructicola]KAF4904178.1 hypothetical protein CGCFRS4_v001256 [Colletotrichum fructicola]KAF4938302.1 hypothetical protein CGCF245_v004757 [Colletotrichum fructicola]
MRRHVLLLMHSRQNPDIVVFLLKIWDPRQLRRSQRGNARPVIPTRWLCCSIPAFQKKHLRRAADLDRFSLSPVWDKIHTDPCPGDTDLWLTCAASPCWRPCPTSFLLFQLKFFFVLLEKSQLGPAHLFRELWPYTFEQFSPKEGSNETVWGTIDQQSVEGQK